MNQKAILGIVIVAILFFYLLFTIFYEADEFFDIVIVGSGLAGLSAGFESYRNAKGALKVIILEKETNYGGNSKKATSGINLLETPIQSKKNITDTFQLFYDDTMNSSKNLSNPELVVYLVNDSKNLFSFYQEIGIDLDQVSILGGHSVPRTHRPSNAPIGYSLVSRLFNLLYHDTNIEIRYNSNVIDLIYDEGDDIIKGVKYVHNNQTKYIRSKAVILASGGYGHDFDSTNSLLKEYAPHLLNFPTTNGAQTQGIGIKLGIKIGADTVNLDKVQIHPTGFVDVTDNNKKNKILAPELLRGVGGILINQTGERFCNELGYRDYVTEKIIENCKKAESDLIDQYEAYLILNQESVDKYGKNINFYIKQGYLQFYNSFEDFAENYNISKIILEKTIASYNMSANNNKDEFNKTIFPTKFNFNSSIYAGIVTPSIHYTMGGLKMNTKGEILNKNNSPIKGLYGCGEVTGGVHGGNRLGGNSLLECAVFGKRASENAIQYIKSS